MEQENGKERCAHKRLKVFLIIIAAIIALYIAGAVYFCAHFYLGSSVFGIEVWGQTVDEVKEEIEDKVLGYTLKIRTRSGDESLSASELGISYNDQGEVEELFSIQTAPLWFLMPLSPDREVSVSMKVDDGALDAALLGLDCMQDDEMIPPADAYAEYNEEEGLYEIIPETYGSELDFEKVRAAVFEAIDEGAASVDLDAEGCYIEPQVLKGDVELQAKADSANKLLGAEITYDFGDRQEVVDADEILPWIVFDEDGGVDLDYDAVHDYVYDLGIKYDTYGKSREFTKNDGKTIMLGAKGDYGWCIWKDKTTDELIELIKGGEVLSTEPVYLYSAICRDTNDIGGTYVEISISAQKMWLYQDFKQILVTDVVTGNVSKKLDTPANGVWAIDARLSPYTLKGADYSSDVTYWLPFNGGVGIHDASWRSKFGKEIYKTNGSHGCVNTPLEAMKTVYEVMKVGYPVVVY